MATWPSGNKPVTTTTDADSDSISGARADINKAITNQIEIIDMFNIPGSPTDNYILKYNASTGVFDMEADSGGTITSVTNFSNNFVVTASGATTLNGEDNLLFDGLKLSSIANNPGDFNLVVQNGVTTGSGITTILGGSSTVPTTGDHIKCTSETTGGSQGEVFSVNAQGGISNTPAPTFTQADTPIQLTGTQPNPGGYYGYITVDNGTSRGSYNYSSRTAGGGGPNADRHIFFFDLDNDFSARPSGAYQGDQNIWFNANHSSDRADMYFDGFSTAGISAYGHGGNSYAIQALELLGSSVTIKSGGSAVLTVDSDSVDITQDIIVTDTKALKFGSTPTTTIDKDEITTTGGFTVNVDSDNSSNEAFTIQSAGTDVMSFSRGPGGDAEMTVKGDGFFIKDDQDDVNFSMDLSSAGNTGINVIRSNENKTLSFTLKTDDNDDTGNYDGSWSFRQEADNKSLILERVDGSAVEIFEIRDSADVATADPVDIFEFKIPPVLPSFTVANLPTTVVAGAQAFCTNDTDGAVNVFYDGSAWRRCTDRAVAST